MDHRRKGAAALSAALVAGAGAAWAQGADAPSCTGLRDVVVEAGVVTSARVVEAASGPYGDLPAYCEVRATALPAISIEVRLPLGGWNGKLYQTGCGGFCGLLGRADAQGGFVNAMGPGLARGYATATSDSGHHGLSVVDAAWADANPQGERDWGWRSIGETNRVAQALIEAFYDGLPERAYFQGCSTGGRMAQRAALTYPEMFDGIISGAPAMDYTGLVATAMAWSLQANTDESGERILGPDDAALIGEAVVEQCDGVDGAEDGVIADPRECSVDLAPLACEAGGDDAAEDGACLTEAETTALRAWREGPRDSAGKQLYPGGIPEGSEPFWPLWLTGSAEGAAPLLDAFTTGFGAYMAFPRDPGPDHDPLAFDFDRDPERLAAMAEVYNADSTDLSAFVEAGGKMIVWHGWADALVTPMKTVEWHEALAGSMGGEAARDGTVRLFMIPGLDHCGLQPGPDGVSQADLDPLTALEAWVERGVAPETVMADTVMAD